MRALRTSARPMTPAAPARNIRLTRLRQLRLTEPSGPQIFVEPIDRPPPGFFGRRLIVAWRRVVVEAVVGAFVDVTLVRDARLGEGGVEGRPAAGDTLIEFAILRVDRRLDFRRVGRVRLEAIEWDGGVEIGTQAHRELIDDPAAETEADRPELAGRIGQGFQPPRRGGEILLHLDRVDPTEELAALFVVAGIAADRGQAVGGEGDEIGERQ